MRYLISATVLALALTACGGSDDSSDDDADSNTSAGSTAEPKCADVIKVGETLPDDYEGCIDDEGALAPALMYDCDDGREFWVVGDDLVSFKGEAIQEDPDGALFSECKP